MSVFVIFYCWHFCKKYEYGEQYIFSAGWMDVFYISDMTITRILKSNPHLVHMNYPVPINTIATLFLSDNTQLCKQQTPGPNMHIARWSSVCRSTWTYRMQIPSTPKIRKPTRQLSIMRTQILNIFVDESILKSNDNHHRTPHSLSHLALHTIRTSHSYMTHEYSLFANI